MKLSIGFSKPRNKYAILSWLIRKIEQTEFSHVFIAWESSWLETSIVYEASSTMVHFSDGNVFNQRAEVVECYEFTIPDEKRKQFLKFAMQRASLPYSVKQLLWIALFKVTTILKLPTAWIPKDGRDLYVCSELIAEILSYFLGAEFDKDLDFVTPKDVLEAVRKMAKMTNTKPT